MINLKQRLNRYKEILNQPSVGILPGQIAFFLVLSIFPLLTLIGIVASFFSVSVDSLVDIMNNAFPQSVADTLIQFIQGKGFDTNVGLFNLIAFFGATNGTYAIIKTANNLYKIKDTDVIKDRIKSVLLLVNILLLLIFLIIVPTFGENILSFVQNSEVFAFLTDEVVFIFNLAKWPFTFFVIYFNIKLIYTISPSRILLSKNTTLGSLVATLLWIVSSIIFGYYLEYFANYDILYGNLSSIIILMIWLYIISFSFVLGMIINKYHYKDELKEEK